MQYLALSVVGLAVVSSLSVASTLHSSEPYDTRSEINLTEAIERFVKASIDRSYQNDHTTTELSIVNARSIENLQCPDRQLSITSTTPSLRGGRTTLLLECQTVENGWKRYASVIVKILAPTVVSSRHLRKGQVLTEADIHTLPIDHLKLRRGAFDDPKFVAGKKVVTNVGPNQVITPTMIERSYLIEEGDSVSIYSNSSALSVSADGISLSNGVKGDRVSVRNVRSNRVLKAIVKQTGVVIVH